jgi:hypothetical protein
MQPTACAVVKNCILIRMRIWMRIMLRWRWKWRCRWRWRWRELSLRQRGERGESGEVGKQRCEWKAERQGQRVEPQAERWEGGQRADPQAERWERRGGGRERWVWKGGWRESSLGLRGESGEVWELRARRWGARARIEIGWKVWMGQDRERSEG